MNHPNAHTHYHLCSSASISSFIGLGRSARSRPTDHRAGTDYRNRGCKRIGGQKTKVKKSIAQETVHGVCCPSAVTSSVLRRGNCGAFAFKYGGKESCKKTGATSPKTKSRGTATTKVSPSPAHEAKGASTRPIRIGVEVCRKIREEKTSREKKQVKEFDKNILNVLEKHKSVAANPTPNQLASMLGRVTQSDKNAIRRQIERCWNPPVGAKNAEELTVELRLYVTPDGTVQTVNVVDKARAASDPYFRAAVESAYRAVLNPRCRQLKFPLDKYEQFKTMTIVFDPREMLGR